MLITVLNWKTNPPAPVQINTDAVLFIQANEDYFDVLLKGSQHIVVSQDGKDAIAYGWNEVN